MTTNNHALSSRTAPLSQVAPRAQRVGLLALAGLAIALTLGAALLFNPPYTFKGTLFAPAPTAPAFALMNQDEQLVRSSDFEGKPVFVYFGWTNCKKACPLTLTKWKRVANLLPSDADNARFVFISIDPQRDTPAVVKAYLATYNSKFIGLVGTLAEIDTVLQEYLAFYKEDLTDPDDPSFLHTTTTYVIDKRGRLVLAFGGEIPAEDMAADLRVLLKQ